MGPRAQHLAEGRNDSPDSLERHQGPADTLASDFTAMRQHAPSCHFKPPGCGSVLQQPQETDSHPIPGAPRQGVFPCVTEGEIFKNYFTSAKMSRWTNEPMTVFPRKSRLETSSAQLM